MKRHDPAAVKRFVEKAIEGGWQPVGMTGLCFGGYSYGRVSFASSEDGSWPAVPKSQPLAEILLDPLAWQGYWKASNGHLTHEELRACAHHSMREMVDELNTGGTIESYLSLDTPEHEYDCDKFSHGADGYWINENDIGIMCRCSCHQSGGTIVK